MPWTPFSMWSDIWASSMDIAQAGMKFGEMMGASRHVIESRSRSIAAAARDPMKGDYAELGRMVPEKVEAFSRAGSAAFADLCAIQSDAVANWMLLGGIAAAGRMPTSAEMTRLAGRSARMGTRASAAAGKAVGPIHRRATANARRLKRKKPG